MSREDTRNEPHAVSIKPQSANLCRLITIVVLTTILAFAYVIIRRPADSLGDPSDQYMVKNIPSIYTKLECIDPEERDVFEGFRTSFLPAEEVNLARQQFIENSVEDDNVTSDTLIWGESEKPQEPATRVKRHFGFDTGSSSQSKEKEEASDYYDGDKENESEVQEDIDSSEANDPYNDENLHSVVHPELHVDRGPLDDVVEQVRGQPELEEGEMSSSASLFKKPSMSYTGIHAFWKGEGDRKTIRDTQAAIMKQYMDAEADPCQDFYQYACGNWANLNPIPADKAGYDTFEMLRENLDSVLKELLEFKPCEMIYSQYPGPHLDTQNIYLLNEHHDMVKISNSTDAFVKNVSHAANFAYDTQISRYHIEIKNRIRRYLNNTRKKAPVPKKLKFRKDKYEYRINRVKRQILNRKHKPNKKLLSRMKSLRNIKSNKEFRLARKLMMAKTKKQKSRKTRETKSSKKDKCKPVCEKKEDGQSCYELMDPANGDAALKARFLFRSCMNYEILDKRGHQPLLDLLDLLGGWPILNSSWSNRNFDWLGLMANLRLYNNDILISEWVGPDIKNSDEFVIQFDQTSLGLPTRDYFLQQSNKVYLNAYKDYLIKIALLLGGSNRHVKKSANDLIDFETKLAKITSAPEDRRNVSELYRRMPLHKLEALVPDIEWRRYLCIVMNRTVGSNETVVLFALPYVRHLVDLIDETPNPTLANYLMWRFVRHRVNNLDDRFQSAKQQFYFVLFGREQAPPRWKNCISQVNSNMGMALGSMFVRKYFDETSKNDTLTMTREIQTSFRELLNLIGWIDDQTKSLAARKVDAMMLRIGYPDFILVQRELDERYKEVIIHPDKYFENILNILQHLTKMEQSRIGQPVNKTLWNTAPAVVNAYYSRNKNQIMFPAGILQPPFYHRHFPRSLNYGGIGVVIGHEITHGFDDKGRLFDCDGNLHRWWSDSAIESFHRRAQCLIDQYGLYLVPEVHMKLDGMNTQGENIADNGGVKQAFRAYLNWTQKHGVSGETLPGLNHTHTQLFFLNFAQVWCGAMRPEAMRNKLKTAVHSPGRFRVIGTLSNSHDFAREFKCPPGSPMNPVHKCTVW